MKTIKEIASDILAKHSNGFGVSCEAVTEAIKKYNVSFADLFYEIVRQGNLDKCECNCHN